MMLILQVALGILLAFLFLVFLSAPKEFLSELFGWLALLSCVALVALALIGGPLLLAYEFAHK